MTGSIFHADFLEKQLYDVTKTPLKVGDKTSVKFITVQFILLKPNRNFAHMVELPDTVSFKAR